MLIYNYQKEFMGMGAKDLKTLGFSDLSQLRSESADFADLFVRTPGYIHNFKHVHWIDFIACADPSETSRVIIDVNGKTFKATLSLENAFLTDNPTSPAYFVELSNLKILSDQEIENISTELAQKPTPTAATKTTHKEQEPTKEVFIKEEAPKATQTETLAAPTLQVDNYDIPQSIAIEEEEEKELAPLEIPDSIEMDVPEMDAPSLELDKEEEVVEHEEEISTYNYDPQVASDELGLPLDLIEEFIQDFIAQAHEFKDGLYSSLAEGDLDNVKVLSHKLKGVAANLRIEDAFDTLSIINTSDDTSEIKSKLNLFYKIIAKLSGKSIQEETLDLSEPKTEEEIEPEYQLQEEDLSFAEDIELNFEEPKELNISLSEEYSKEEAAKEIGLDTETFDELFQDYINESNNIVEKMTDSLQNDDLTTLQSEAIKLKGMSDNMRITSLVKELDTLVNSSDKNEMADALKQAKVIIQNISK